MENEILYIVKTFFEKLNINITSYSIIKVNESNIFNIIIKTEESWLIIWHNWKNLDAIQNIINLLWSKKIWERLRIHLEINDYIKTKDDKLFGYVKSKINYVKRTKKSFCLPFFSAYDRKKIHDFISEMNDPLIYTKSIWDWNDRRLYICIQERKLELDIDWNDI